MKKATYSPLSSSSVHNQEQEDLEINKNNHDRNHGNNGDMGQFIQRPSSLQHFEISQESKSDHDELVNNGEELLQIERNWRLIWMILFFGLLFGVLAGFAFKPPPPFMETSGPGFNATNIAFGSCSSYDLRDLNIFTDAIIPSKPDAWIWAGDFVYLDETDINCAIFQPSQDWQQTCNCTSTWYQEPPFTCKAGDLDYAQSRWMKGLNNAPYNSFLEYMCPKSMEQGVFPPDGSNPAQCARPIYGIYDDHDFGHNNGNEREQNKRVYKNFFLDAIGEPMDSIRRNDNRGAWTSYKLNEGHPHLETEIILLDERYEREMIPCETRQEYCEAILSSSQNRISPSHVSMNEIAWCKDFIQGGPLGKGTCCSKDQDIYYKWCLIPENRNHQYYRDVCDVTYDQFGMKSLVYDPVTNDIIPAKYLPDSLYDQQQQSPFCEVLGKQQRKWLRHLTSTSSSPIKLFVSGSVAIYNPSPYPCGQYYTDDNHTNEKTASCYCGGDNIDCYRTAQQELLYLMQKVQGCSIILTGDYHFSDIKLLKNGQQIYSNYYSSTNFTQNIYQLMSSGLTYSTGRNVTCEDYRKDPMGLRTHSECSFVRGPNFGKVILNYDEMKQKLKSITLQVLSGLEANKVLLETVIDPHTCNPIQAKANPQDPHHHHD